jgi:hypothetical protein
MRCCRERGSSSRAALDLMLVSLRLGSMAMSSKGRASSSVLRSLVRSASTGWTTRIVIEPWMDANVLSRRSPSMALRAQDTSHNCPRRRLQRLSGWTNGGSRTGQLGLRPPSSGWPPRWLAMLHGPNDPARGHCLHPVPLPLPGLHVFSPLDEIGLALASGTRRDSMGSEWGLGALRIGSTTPDVSAIHWSPRAGSQGEGSLATRRSARADERRPAAAPAERSKTRAGRANRRPRTRAPHGEERSEKTGGRASARTANDRDRSTW